MTEVTFLSYKGGSTRGERPARQEAQIIQSVRIRHGQGVAAPPRSEPCSRGGDEAAEAKGINEVGCNMCERITIPKYPHRRGRQSGRLEGNIAVHRYLRDGSGSVGIPGDNMFRDGVSVNLGDLLDSDLPNEEGGML